VCESLILNNTSLTLSEMENKWKLKTIKFKNLSISPGFLIFIMRYNKLSNIRFINCQFYWNQKDKFLDVFFNLKKSHRDLYISFQSCIFNKPEFNINEKYKNNKYLIDKLLLAMQNDIIFFNKDNKWYFF
jgi:hypothetical protein